MNLRRSQHVRERERYPLASELLLRPFGHRSRGLVVRHFRFRTGTTEETSALRHICPAKQGQDVSSEEEASPSYFAIPISLRFRARKASLQRRHGDLRVPWRHLPRLGMPNLVQIYVKGFIPKTTSALSVDLRAISSNFGSCNHLRFGWEATRLGPNSANSGPTSVNVSELWLGMGHVWPGLEVSPISTIFGRLCPGIDRLGVGGRRPDWARLRPSSARIGP